ncbi:MAG TPA: DUF3465 domain-containing protein [Pyrinomonadaceae bacterium]|nr:DUF3465 domain-containing protein [Pyrinomonadaceae bacterium]
MNCRISAARLRFGLLALVLCLTALAACRSGPVINTDGAVSDSDRRLAHAFEQHESNLQVEGKGRVRQILPDDNNGTRHQRFIVELETGQTILIAHNIDLAPRIDLLQVGDEVTFFGEYEWNAKGGVIHWTHRDPNGRHIAGWIKYLGRVYQ